MQKNRLSIRSATDDDLGDLLRVEKRCFSRGPYIKHQFNCTQYRYYVRNPNAIVLLGFLDNKPVASAISAIASGSRLGSAKILSIAVVKNKRRQGIGMKVLKRVIQKLQSRGCQRIYLEVSEKAFAAKALFESMGFKRERWLLKHYGPSNHGMRMLLTLD